MTDKYNTFDKEWIEYSYPKYTYTDYNKPTYTMDYEDIINIPFAISAEYINYLINIYVYNARGELVYVSDEIVDETQKIYLKIDGDTSSTIFIPGIYKIKLQAQRISNDYDDITTILNCSIYVRK